MASEVSIVSNETSILASLNDLLPDTASRATLTCIFILALAFHLLRRIALAKVTHEMQWAMYDAEWIYFSSLELGLLHESKDDIIGELLRLQNIASQLREQSLCSSVSSWGRLSALVRGLPFAIMRCTADARRLKIRLEIQLEIYLRRKDNEGQKHFFWTIWNSH
ncbi:hypothetical protein R3P38DRAFT_3103273 [Favolaschia claudopus]|uniref:Uncharacterized protein n=1 Tax=Favolaschia claudopus TaxID=2862362 RepID=A0AAV9ZL22_9AGAR